MRPLTTLPRLVLILLSLCLISGVSMSQNPQPSPQPAPANPAANPADVNSMDAIIAAVYDVISGPAGKKRNWDRMRSLFLPGARLIPTNPRQPAVMVPASFRLMSISLVRNPLWRKRVSSRRKRRERLSSLVKLHTSSVPTSRATHLTIRNRFNAASTVFS